MELHGDLVVLRPLSDADVDRIVELGSHPEVARWWPGLTPAHVAEKARGEDDGAVVLAILVDGEVAGMIQYLEETDPEYRHASMDVFLGEPYHGRGLGTDTVRTLARHLIVDRGHRRLTIDPAAHKRARDPLLREGRLQAGRRHARVLARPRRHPARRPPARPARGRAAVIRARRD